MCLYIRNVLISDSALAKLCVFMFLDCSEAVSDVCHDDKEEEETKGEIGLPLLNKFVEKFYKGLDMVVFMDQQVEILSSEDICVSDSFDTLW